MEYLGQTQTATYMMGPRQMTQYTQLPTIGTMQNTYKTYDTFPAPSPLRRSLTTLPWRPSTYYQMAKVNPASAVTRSMPDPMAQRTQLSELDALKVPPVFAAARNALYTRFTPNDWMASNQGNYLASDRVRSGAERLRMDTVRLCRETDDKTKRTQSDVGKRLGERIGDISFWKTELNHETDNMITETNQLNELEKDSSDKFVAENLDTNCHGLRNASRGIAYHDGVHRIDNTLSVPETWAKYSNNNIQRSQSERAASKNMRNEIESVINACNNEMWQEWNSVNVALNQRSQETTDARNRIQTHLSKVLQEIYDMEKNIELLKKAIQDKEQPMQVAQTRLDTRLRRPNVELCRDPVQHRLVEEVGEITNTVDNLQHKLREAENALQALLRTKAALEQDLSIKNNSLFIDREKCLAMRKTFPMAPRIVSV
ncbi:tektin-3-like [Plakobranchus ocellatus]|uniref:Tektin n=1 Tax=Plakobranchus ocellatus TaxID=259542 RepID=A0AAV4ABR8_9GAST|nr:tektin-3-like [Plakobranchus ocellatus]